jgi:uncharacterized protein YndB with AHSA1/START domain
MSAYERTLSLNVPADAVFAYVSDPANMPEYLHTVNEAVPEPVDRLRLRGNAGGHAYDVSCLFKVDAGAHSMEWSTPDAGHNYSGQLRVEGGDVVQDLSEIFVTLSFGSDPVSDTPTERDERILESIEATLENIRSRLKP